MSPRRKASEQRTTPIADINVGDVDTMSVLARSHSLPLCAQPNLRRPVSCTRAAGHSESEGLGKAAKHASTKHVSADATGVARAVWSH